MRGDALTGEELTALAPGSGAAPRSAPTLTEDEAAAWRQVAMLGGEALQPTSDATTVREQNGKVMTTDGPFAETKEQLGGYYLIDAPNLDDAIEAASKMPNIVTGGSVEVRPIQEFD